MFDSPVSELLVESRFFTAADGLRLHVRQYGGGFGLPIVCLPGLARTAEDFDSLARRLAAPGRRVVALDYRGRGLSDFDPDWRRYDIFVESDDIQTVLTGLGITEALFVGTSRGGLHIMALAALRPGVIRAAVINDIGPVIESAGLARIRGYVGKLPQPASYADAVDMLKRLFGAQFSAVPEEGWMSYARLTFGDSTGALKPRYDPRLMKTLELLDLEKGVPELWPQFDGLKDVPLLVIRGENSDLLAPKTLAAMAARHPGCETWTVPGQGHAPLLMDKPTLARIAAFVDREAPAAAS